MLREVIFTSICFMLVSGCALTETANTDDRGNSAASAANSVPESTTVEPPVITTLPEASVSAGDKQFGPEYIRDIQTRLKRSGFYSGAIDGIAGAKTQSAIRHFQSGCATLNDLISISDITTAVENKIVAQKTDRGEAVRIIQLRLKDAGFDPGPIDGIAGAKTRSALAALESGCKMLDGIGPMSFGEARLAQPGPSKIIKASAVNGGADNSAELASGKLSQEAIKALQRGLSEAGCDPGPADGILGPKTKAAAQRYQSSRP